VLRLCEDAPMSDLAVDPQHPWLGLASFTEDTRAWFYGRDDEVTELTRRVQRKLLTVLFGQSGLGKTSILRAGVAPRLRLEGYCPVYVRLDHAPQAPAPAEQIKQAILRATAASGHWTKPGAAIEGETLWEFLHHRDDVLLDDAGKPLTPLLIFDQFEEIFTLAQGDDAGRQRAASFIDDLADLVENRLPRALEAELDDDESVIERFDLTRGDYRVLIALREDYLAHLEGIKGQMPSITQNRMRLARMTGAQALDAVRKPGGVLVNDEVAEAVVRFVAGGAELRNAEVEPSLLSLICRELNNTRIAQGRSEVSVDLLAGSRETFEADFRRAAVGVGPVGLASRNGDPARAHAAAKGVREGLLQLQPTDTFGRERIAEALRLLHLALGWAELQAKDFAAAQSHFSHVAEARKVLPARTLRQRLEAADDAALLAITLARGGRLDDARALAEPALAWQREQQARMSEFPWRHWSLALALVAAAETTPPKANSLLADAQAELDRLPAEMRAARTSGMLQRLITDARLVRR
jgi:hypothetical protein